MITLDIISLNDQKKLTSTIETWRKSLFENSDSKKVIAIKYPYHKYWIKGKESQTFLTAVCIYYQEEFLFIVDENLLDEQIILKQYKDPKELYHFFKDHLEIEWISLLKGFHLHPVYIPKSWGQEIWYTGIEERGISLVKLGKKDVLFPYILSFCPQCIVNGDEKNIILLKVLDPLPDPNCGDLYFELHEKKKEVYIISEIDRSCYPNGKGKVKLGINQKEYQKHTDKEIFKQSMLKSIINYKQTLDRIYDIVQNNYYRTTHQNDVSPIEYTKILKILPQTIQNDLAEKYAKVEEFCHFEEIEVGDVLTVNSLVPHSLLHGIKVVEFQTPYYERLIISFNQKVITQDDWDSKKAISLMDCTPQSKNLEFTLIENTENVIVEKIASFSDFVVKRIHLKNKHTSYQEIINGYYFLIICLQGSIKLIFSDETSVILEKDQSFFITAKCKKLTIENEMEHSIYLKSVPLIGTS